MNCVFRFSRRLNCLNKSFLLNKFNTNFDSFSSKISSNQLIFRQLSDSNFFRDVEELEERIKKTKENGGQTTDLLRKLLSKYSQKYEQANPQNSNNQFIVNRVKRMSKQINENTNQSNDSLNSFLMEFFTTCGELELALEANNRISPDFRLDSFKLFNLATLLVKNDRTNAAISLIENQFNQIKGKTDKQFRDKRHDLKLLRDKSINKLLNALIDNQIQMEVIQKVYEMCIQMSPTPVNKMIIGPLIRMHLSNQDLSGALRQFLSCAENYGITPWNIEMMRIFISANDQDSLQAVVRKSFLINGPYVTALDLSAAYLYNNLEDKAKQEMNKVVRVKHNVLEFICDKFIRDNRFDCLKTFVLLTKSIDDIDRQKLFSILINTYKANGQTEDALNVLDLMKAENIEPNEQTLRLLNRN